MRLRVTCLTLVLLGIAAGDALAQQPRMTVQLPSYSYFSLGTTVSVPDRGRVYMGGIKRASTGRNEFGTPMLGKIPYLNRLFNNRSISSERSASNMHVTAYIHNFEELEEQLLGQPSTSRSLTSRSPLRPRSAAIANTLQLRNPTYGGSWRPSLPENSPGGSTMTLADAQARRARLQVERAEEAMEFFQRGEKAEAAGKANVAKIYYQMAARRATGQLKGQVLAKLDAVGRAQTGSKIVQGRP